jgi:transcriptional regulator with XRE-family HTH domain
MPRSRVSNGPAILERRERLGISQQQMAKRIGVTASYLSRIETGVEKPGMATATVRNLALELGASLDDITLPAEEALAS